MKGAITIMSSVNSLNSANAALAAAVAEANTAAATQTTDTSFDELLATMTQSSGNDMQQQIFDGLMDGSLTVTDSHKLVSALISTLDTVDTSAGSTFGVDDATQNALDALLGLSEESEGQSSLIPQSETLAALQQTGDNALLLEYYQAMAAMTEVQKKTLPDV